MVAQTDSPVVSVIMCAFNRERYIKEAIRSILDQTYTNFEFIIINDASTDRTEKIIKDFKDPRINYIKNESNLGIALSANKGIKKSRGKYIARMDADDISLPIRLSEQVEYMEVSEKCVVCGSWVQTFGKDNSIWKYRQDDLEIKFQLMLESHIAQPVVMIRASALKDNDLYYDEDFMIAEDYDLWVKMLQLGKFHNIQKVLLKYRTHYAQITSNLHETLRLTDSVRMKYLKRLGVSPSKPQFELHKQIFKNNYYLNLNFLEQANDWLQRLIEANDSTKLLPNKEFHEYCQTRWYNMTLGSTRLGLGLWKLFKESPLSDYASFDLAFKAKFFTKCLIRV